MTHSLQGKMSHQCLASSVNMYTEVQMFINKAGSAPHCLRKCMVWETVDNKGPFFPVHPTSSVWETPLQPVIAETLWTWTFESLFFLGVEDWKSVGVPLRNMQYPVESSVLLTCVTLPSPWSLSWSSGAEMARDVCNWSSQAIHL